MAPSSATTMHEKSGEFSVVEHPLRAPTWQGRRIVAQAAPAPPRRGDRWTLRSQPL